MMGNKTSKQSNDSGFSSSSDSLEKLNTGLDDLTILTKGVDNISLPFTLSVKWLGSQDLCGDQFGGGESPIPGSDVTGNCSKGEKNSRQKISMAVKKKEKLWIEMVKSILFHGYSKYLLVLVSVAIFVPLYGFVSATLWILTGMLIPTILTQSLTKSTNLEKNGKGKKINTLSKEGDGSAWTHPTRRLPEQLSTTVQQGWMMEFDGDYDPLKNSIHENRIVFVRIEGFWLTVSYPIGRHGITKRRLWTHSPLSSDIKFAEHLIYSLQESHVYLAPLQLAQRRAWNKKYPIAIRLSKDSTVTILTPPGGAKRSPVKRSLEKNKAASNDDNQSIHSAPGYIGLVADEKGAQENVREDVGGKILYLFTRTDREKDEWFRNFIAASLKREGVTTKNVIPDEGIALRIEYLKFMKTVIPSLNGDLDEEKHEESEKQCETPTELEHASHINSTHETKTDTLKNLDKNVFGNGIEIGNGIYEQTVDPSEPDPSTGIENGGSSAHIDKMFSWTQSPAYLNALVGRIFFDFFPSSYGRNTVKEMLQKKLSTIKLPDYLQELLVHDVDLGTRFPRINRVSEPTIDNRGLWIDLDIIYDGTISLTLDVKTNWMKTTQKMTNEADEKTKIDQDEDEGINHTSDTEPPRLAGHMFDSDAYDSGESSEDEEDENWNNYVAHQDLHEDKEDDLVPALGTVKDSNKPHTHARQPKKNGEGKMTRMAKKVCNFNPFTETKNAFRDMVNTPVGLVVEVKSFVGTFVINIPPPPTDRIWYGFRSKPDVEINAKPKVGDMNVNLTHLIDWIGNKILHELEKIIVLPNMDDLPVGLMEFKLPTS